MNNKVKKRKPVCIHDNIGYCDECVSDAEYMRCELRKLKAKKKVRPLNNKVEG